MFSIYKVLEELINSTYFLSKQKLSFTPNITEQNYWSGVYVHCTCKHNE